MRAPAGELIVAGWFFLRRGALRRGTARPFQLAQAFEQCGRDALWRLLVSRLFVSRSGRAHDADSISAAGWARFPESFPKPSEHWHR